jgi:hypothetical protein
MNMHMQQMNKTVRNIGNTNKDLSPEYKRKLSNLPIVNAK